MVDRLLLSVLYLSGCFSFSTSLQHQYHYVPDLKTWTEAQTYCRQTYTDLATIENTEQMNQIINISSAASTYKVWTGLYSQINWMWSDGYTGGWSYNTTWPSLKTFLGQQWCMNVNSSGGWWYGHCYTKQRFICYNGTQLNPQLTFVEQTMNWTSAQTYCRENFIDLVTVRNNTENLMVHNLTQTGYWAWIGLSGDFNLYWSDGSGINSVLWNYILSTNNAKTTTCGIVQGTTKLFSFSLCNTRLPFVCYSPPPPAISRLVVKSRMTSSVDLNDPVVRANILKQLQDRLMEKGMSGVNLKWTEQPDGKVFHKEGETTVTHDGC